MPPKKADGASKKNDKKKKEKLLEDRTFGLKNKNKSKKVQQYIQGVAANVYTVDPKQRRLDEERKKLKENAKLAKKAMLDEQNALFGAALLAVQKKGTESGKVEAKGRDGEDDGTKKAGTSRAMKMMFQMDAQEMEERLKEDPNYVPTLEDEIESKRQKLVMELKASGKPGTPVTPETFKIWQDKKRKRRAEEAKKLVEAELKKKKGGKGLSILSGRDLYEYKKELFVDDENAADDIVASDRLGANEELEEVAQKVEQSLFLDEEADVDLDDLDD